MTWREMHSLAAVAVTPLVLATDDPTAAVMWLLLCGYVAWLWANSTEESS